MIEEVPLEVDNEICSYIEKGFLSNSELILAFVILLMISILIVIG